MNGFTWPSVVGMALVILITSHVAVAAEVEHEDVLQVNTALSLHDVLQVTIKNHPEQSLLQSQQYHVDAKKALAEGLLPSAPAISISHQNDKLGSGRNERDYQAALELPLWLSSQREARAKVAEFSALHVGARQSSLAIEVAGLLREAVWEIAFRKNEVALYEEKYQSAVDLAQKVHQSLRAGEVAKTDWLLAQQETLLASKNKILAQAEVMHAQFRYKQLTGIDQYPEAFAEEKSTLMSFENSPAWQAVLTKVQYAEEERKLAHIEQKENMQILVNAKSSQGAFDQQYNHSMGVSVRIPIGTSASQMPIVAASELALGAAISARERMKRVLEAALHEADHNLGVSEQELVIAKQHNDIARESLRLAKKAYALGEHGLTTLLRIKNQAFDAERSYRAMQIQHQWNIARYNQAVGVLP